MIQTATSWPQLMLPQPSERPEHYLAEVPHPLGVVSVITVSALWSSSNKTSLQSSFTAVLQAFNFPIAVAFWNWALSFGVQSVVALSTAYASG